MTGGSERAAQRIVVIGAGGHGRETVDVIHAAIAEAHARGLPPAFELVGIAADEADPDLLARTGTTHLGPVEPVAELAARLAELGAAYHVAVGSPRVRARLDLGLADAGATAVSVVDPSASIGSACAIGPGAYLGLGARITTNVVAGRHLQLNVNAVVSHDCTLGDHVTLSPGALVNGSCTLGDRVFLGTGAVVIPGCRIGEDAVIGAGATVTGDVPPGVTAVGSPARW